MGAASLRRGTIANAKFGVEYYKSGYITVALITVDKQSNGRGVEVES